MPKDNLLGKHVRISLFTLAFLLGLVALSFYFAENFFLHPESYFQTNLSPAEAQFFLVRVALIVCSTLVAYIVYLLLSSKTRARLIAGFETRRLTDLVTLYEDAPVPYFTLDKNGAIFSPNKSALRFFGVLPEEIVGQDFFAFLAPEERDLAEKLLQYYKADIPINRQETEMMTKSGERRTVMLSLFGMKDPYTRQRTGLATVFDVTEEKRLDKAKTEFVSLASHQLRSPLATVKWYTDMLLSGGIGELSEKQKDYVSRLHFGNEEMIDLVDTLLNISRIESGSIVVKKEHTNVEELCKSVLSELALQIDKKKLNIEKKYIDVLKNVHTDPILLRVVIQNLISNAVKYTPDEGTVSISFEDSGREKKIIVTDTGLGITKSQQDKVFSKMFRADNVRNLSASQGSGLGLYLVKSIMQTLGGDISFVSEEGKGSTFTITF